MSSTPIDTSKIVPLVTGGGTGIGWGLAMEFIKRGSPKVLICGRREGVLKEAAEKCPGRVFYLVNDVGNSTDRELLLRWVKTNHPDCNALVNNAAQKRFTPPALDSAATWGEKAKQIDANFAGPVHLISLFIPWFLAKRDENCLIVNVSSALCWIPLASDPIYSATKAALHSYSMAMRHSLGGSNIRMIEIVPPAVKTDMNPNGEEDCDIYCAVTMDGLEAGTEEICFKYSEEVKDPDRPTILKRMEEFVMMFRVPSFAGIERND